MPTTFRNVISLTNAYPLFSPVLWYGAEIADTYIAIGIDIYPLRLFECLVRIEKMCLKIVAVFAG